MSSRCEFALKIADDVGPFARRGERDRARPLAHREALDRLKRNIALRGETAFKRFEQARALRTLARFAGDANEQGNGQTAALGVHGASIPVGKQWARREIGSLSGDHERSLAAPPAALRNPSAHGRSPGSRRIADAAFPGLRKPSGEKASARRSQSRGRPRNGKKPTVFPFHPRVQSRDRASVHVPASEGVVKSSATRFCATRRPLQPRAAVSRLNARRRAHHREDAGADVGGQLFEWFGRRTSRTESGSQLPQCSNLGVREDEAPGRDGAFSLR